MKKIFRANHGACEGTLFKKDLAERIKQRSKAKGVSCNIDISEWFKIALVTPFMLRLRVHNYVRQAGELVFLDASGNMDR